MGGTIAFAMSEGRIIPRRQLVKFAQDVVNHIRVGVLVNGQARGGMLAEDQHSPGKVRRDHRRDVICDINHL